MSILRWPGASFSCRNSVAPAYSSVDAGWGGEGEGLRKRGPGRQSVGMCPIGFPCLHAPSFLSA